MEDDLDQEETIDTEPSLGTNVINLQFKKKARAVGMQQVNMRDRWLNIRGKNTKHFELARMILLIKRPDLRVLYLLN